jgi:hypothetical protein
VLHLLAISFVEQPTPLRGAQDAASHLHLHRLWKKEARLEWR